MSGDHAIPTIGITLPARATDSAERQRVERNAAKYRLALEHYGALVIEIRPGDGLAVLDTVDGVVLSGGGDLDPRHYSRKPHPKTGPPDAPRDELELSVARAASGRAMPILGICRGAQMLGVALGGQLVQDVDSELPESEEHSASAGGRAARHWVELAPDSRLAAIMRSRRVRVNSYHHQANSQLGPGVIRAAWSRDGVTEAIEGGGPGFALGVQWHPERLWRQAPRQRRLFAAFVDACRAIRRGGQG